MKLSYIYQGSSGYAADLEFYRRQLGAERRWEFDAFGARVAALELGQGALILLHDHSRQTRCVEAYTAANPRATLD